MEAVQNTCIQSSDYRDLPVAQLVESPTNPRKRYDPTSLQELAESIRAQGVLAPLLVRPVGERFEIVAGSRRFRAAQLAQVESVPVRVVELTDADAIIAQVVENLQRENVHPLEEAHGFRALLNLADQRYTVALIAAKAGKNPQYVAQRLKLTELIAPAAEAFLADKLTVGHALLIAKLPDAQQAEALQAAFKSTWTANGQAEVLVPVRELAVWIEANVLLDLHAAPFDRTDESLVCAAGSCHQCPKRTGANTLLFPETDRDQCLDRNCYQEKVSAHLARMIESDSRLIHISTAWGARNDGVLGRGQYVEILATKAAKNGRRETAPERKRCPHVTKAIVVEGASCGHVVNVCADPSCDTHHAASRKAREAQESLRVEQRRQGERRKQELATRNRVLAATLEKVTAPLGKADLELVAREFLSRLPQDHRAFLSQRHAPAKSTGTKSTVEIGDALKNLDEAGYCRLLVEIALLDTVHNTFSSDGGKRLGAVAKHYRVNAVKIAESVAAEFAARRKKRVEPGKSQANATDKGSRTPSSKGKSA